MTLHQLLDKESTADPVSASVRPDTDRIQSSAAMRVALPEVGSMLILVPARQDVTPSISVLVGAPVQIASSVRGVRQTDTLERLFGELDAHLGKLEAGQYAEPSGETAELVENILGQDPPIDTDQIAQSLSDDISRLR